MTPKEDNNNPIEPNTNTPPQDIHGNNQVGHNQYTNSNPREPYSVKYLQCKVYLDEGKTYKEIRAITGLAYDTISKVSKGGIQVNKSVLDLVKKHESAKLALLGNEILDGITEEDKEKASLMQKVTSYGILTDKRRLLDNESTSNIGIKGVIDGISSEIDDIKNTKDQLKKDLEGE